MIFRGLVVAGLLSLLGCGLFPARLPDPFAGANGDALTIRVENPTREDVEIEVAAAGLRESLGRVSARSRDQFQLPWPGSQEIRFHVNLIAGPRHTTRGVVVGPGDQIEMFIQTPIERTVVRRR